jgi:hypothetical protein
MAITRPTTNIMIALVAALLGLSAYAVPPANAAASAGASVDCADFDLTKCVTAEGKSVNVGTSLTGVQGVAACAATSTGGLITEIECSTEFGSQTRSFPGVAAATVMLPTPDDIDEFEVCWTAKGFFTDPFGATVEVETSDCSLVSI